MLDVHGIDRWAVEACEALHSDSLHSSAGGLPIALAMSGQVRSDDEVLRLVMCLVLGAMPARAQETPLAERLVAQVKACLKIPDETLEYGFRVTMVVTTDSKGRLNGGPVPLVRPKSPAMKAFV